MRLHMRNASTYKNIVLEIRRLDDINMADRSNISSTHFQWSRRVIGGGIIGKLFGLLQDTFDG
jgi:hypothetical protein